MAVLLGLLVAVCFGSGDFIGARASQRASTTGVLFVAQLAALAGAVIVTGLISADITGRDLAFGALAGCCNVIGLGLLYHGLATGRMSIVAPVTAVVGATVPVTWGLIEGERPSTVALIGVGCALVAGALLAREEEPEERSGGRTHLAIAIGAGLGLGTSFIFFAKTSETSGNWPALTARLAATVLVGAVVVVLARRRSVTFPVGTARRLAIGAGVFDIVATTLLLVALRRGLAVVVAPVASLAPGMTVVLAWRVLHERIGRVQLVGLGVAGLGLVLIASG